MENWDEIRTAFQVARAGTVSGAAEVLGVHHATVIRHIDALEAQLGVKLFHRHARGYTPTEAGQDLARVAGAAQDQFAQLAGRLQGLGAGLSGELVVTSLALLSPMVAPILTRFRAKHPDVTLRYLTDDRLFRMEYGEAHVAIRAGDAPQEPDNVVQPFCTHPMHLVAAPSYVEAHGLPRDEAELAQHWFVGPESETSRAPFHKWLVQHVSRDRIVVRMSDTRAMTDAILAGAGIGFMSRWDAQKHPELIDVLPPKAEWAGKLWLVTHVDLHRTAKVQAFLNFLKADVVVA